MHADENLQAKDSAKRGRKGGRSYFCCINYFSSCCRVIVVPVAIFGCAVDSGGNDDNDSVGCLHAVYNIGQYCVQSSALHVRCGALSCWQKSSIALVSSWSLYTLPVSELAAIFLTVVFRHRCRRPCSLRVRSVPFATVQSANAQALSLRRPLTTALEAVRRRHDPATVLPLLHMSCTVAARNFMLRSNYTSI